MTKHALVCYMISAIILFCSFFAAAQQPESNTLVGKWQDTGHLEKKVEMYQQSGAYFGISISPERLPAADTKLVFKDLRWIAEEEVYQGILIDPNGKTEYIIKIQMSGRNKFRFSVSKFVFKKTFQFKRIK